MDTREVIKGLSVMSKGEKVQQYHNAQWHGINPRRLQIDKNPSTGYYEVIDTYTGGVLGNSHTYPAARIIRRRMEARGFGKVQLSLVKSHICTGYLPDPAPWAVANGQSDGVIRGLMHISRGEFYNYLETK